MNAKLSTEQRKMAIDQIIDFYDREKGESMGVIAAGELFDFFQEYIGREFYNKGVNDSKRALDNRMDELRYDLDELKD